MTTAYGSGDGVEDMRVSNLYSPAFDEFDLDESEQALCEYFLRLEFLAGKIEQEVIDALGAWRKCAELEEAIQGEFDAMIQAALRHVTIEEPTEPGGLGRLSLPIIYTPGAAAAELQIEALRLQSESAAGALLLMIDEVIQRLRHSTKDPETGQGPHPKHAGEFALGRLGADEHVTTLIYAAGNAYRHAKDWVGLVDHTGAIDPNHRDYRNSRRTLDLLEKSISLVRVHDEIPCLAAIQRLTGVAARPFSALWDQLNLVGRDYAATYAQGAQSFDKVLEALDAQRAYACVQASFSGNEHLWSEGLPS